VCVEGDTNEGAVDHAQQSGEDFGDMHIQVDNLPDFTQEQQI
jgi:hypothetical protein